MRGVVVVNCCVLTEVRILLLRAYAPRLGIIIILIAVLLTHAPAGTTPTLAQDAASIDLLIELDGQAPLLRRISIADASATITAADALQQAGFTVQITDGQVCAINGNTCPDSSRCDCWQQAGWDNATGVWVARPAAAAGVRLAAGTLEGWRLSSTGGLLPRLNRASVAAQMGLLRLREVPQEADGSIGFQGMNIDAIVGAAANQTDLREWRNSSNLSPIDGMRATAPAYARRNSASAGKLTLGVLASDNDPRTFAGNDTDLVARLRQSYNATAGAFGAINPANDQFVAGNNWDQAFGMLGLAAADPTWDATAAARTLATRANADGGWSFATGSVSDSDSTGLMLQALALAPATDPVVAAARERGIAWLRSAQNSDGGFPTSAGEPSNVNSTAYAVQGLLAAGQNPSSSAWTPATANPVQYLLAAQRADGNFPGFNETLALVQVLPALTGATFQQPPRYRAIQRGQAWLLAQQQPNGSFGADPETTFEAVQALTATKPEPSRVAPTYQSVRAYLASIAPTYGSTQAGQTSRLILALLASGGDPRNVGGVDLVARLQGFAAGATPNGALQTGIRASDQAWAMLALDALREPLTPAMSRYLRDLARPAGGWAVASDQTSLHLPTTALALHALAINAEPATSGTVRAALRAVRATQRDDGSFGTTDDPASPADASATARMVQALLALGLEPRSLAWSTIDQDNRLTLSDPVRWLLRNQTSAGDIVGASSVASAQAVASIALQPLPVQREPFRVYLPTITRQLREGVQ